MNTAQMISPQQAAQEKSTALLLDVRTPAEFEDMHIDGAVLHPLTALDPQRVQQLSSGVSRCIVVCASGGRARQACEKLTQSGIVNLAILEGGIKAWHTAGLPVIQGKKTMSIERQVRIAAGALVFTGSVLGYFVSPGFIGLAAFVGAGLMFAGITDTCGMAMVLARMPWNTRSSGSKSFCATKSSCS
jgi:rhodanese-related sulfurtransferase